MKAVIPFALLLLLAGCAAPPSSPAHVATEHLVDSPPVHEIYDLSGGIDHDWSFTIGEPSASTGLLRFTLAGPVGTPLMAPDLCFTYAYEQRMADGVRTSEGTQGACGGPGNLGVTPEVAVDGKTLFERSGKDALPGTYSFHASGSAQVASLVVDFSAR